MGLLQLSADERQLLPAIFTQGGTSLRYFKERATGGCWVAERTTASIAIFSSITKPRRVPLAFIHAYFSAYFVIQILHSIARCTNFRHFRSSFASFVSFCSKSVSSAFIRGQFLS